MDPVSVTLTRVILGIWLCCQVVAEGGPCWGPVRLCAHVWMTCIVLWAMILP